MDNKALIQIAESASGLITRMQKEARIAKDKGGGDFATEADYASEQKIFDALRKIYPSVPAIGEEAASLQAKIPETCFVFDPLDGTYAYKHGMPYFGVSLGYKFRGVPQCGVIKLPALKAMITVEKSGPPIVDGSPFQFTLKGVPERIALGIDLNYSTDGRVVEKILQPLMQQNRLGNAYNPCAAVRGFHALLTGQIDVYINPSAKIWDLIVGARAVEAAGGLALALNGQPLAWDKVEMAGIFAANQDIADLLLRYTAELA